ncbi:MAG TPA: aldehyde ferredoxin oxidoreductase C-terminal domain-containing protein [Bacteroidales bacterium]|nr:aldehyde ferredoxin oxidoreductase C-terminal domain-containing protein [Bacteroidales bacterium]HPW78669.1 aldehyde ferredoxin oxidoreductase C-terminal domain-containing protein [Bacteroidales bacterium]HQB56183.1 aldehyde ferredoxin oxidoreductase C-terminal domain-containing protein [Bacteroidales bacterium]
MDTNIGDRKVLARIPYNWKPIDKGYTDQSLYVNLDTLSVEVRSVDPLVKEKFVGGKGYGLRMLWDAVTPQTTWRDPENEIVISGGPVCGITQYSGAGKSICVGLSPLTERVVDSNVGGHFGPHLKFAGFDALEVQGIASQEVIVYINGVDHEIEFFSPPAGMHIDSHLLAEELHEMFSGSESDKLNVSVVSAGKAADHSLIGMLNFSFYDVKRKKIRLKQAGRGGLGTLLRYKNVRAIVARIPKVSGNLNNVVDMPAIRERGRRFNKEMNELDDVQCQMRKVGTAHLMGVMEKYDLLPVMNFKYGDHKDCHKIDMEVWKKYFSQGMPDGCWLGCTMMCAKGVDDFELRTGPYKGTKVLVDGPEYETAAALGSNLAVFDPLYVVEQNFYCDTYGICTISWGNIVAFIMECWENGILNMERTGGLDFSWGNAPVALECMHQLARGEGFGLIAGLGVRKMKEMFIEKGWGDAAFLNDIAMENKGMEYSMYISKESLAQQGGYAMTNKGPQHDEAWLIFMDMINNQIPTFEDKAEALHYFPMFRTWFGLAGFCKLCWNDIEPADNAQTDEPAKVPEHVDNYVTVFKAVTGRDFDKEKLISMSERVYNFQRIFNIRMGYGLRKDDAQPYRACGPVTEEEFLSRQERYDKQLKEEVGVDPSVLSLEEKRRTLRQYREDRYERLLDAVYKRRGWNANGVPRIEFLQEIGMDLPELIEVVKPLQ